MKRSNVGKAEFARDESDREGFRAGMARLGGPPGAKEAGVGVYELPSGQAVCPDSDKVGIWTGDKATDVLVRRSSRVDHHDGEV